MIDLISERVGGTVISCNDEFFAAASNMLKSTPPVANDEYTDRGKWMDGWETRRRRDPGHDWCIVALGIPGRVGRVTIDTSNFTGNYPERFSLEASGDTDPERAEWLTLIPETPLRGDEVAAFETAHSPRVEMVRLNIFPDGGVARLRVEGEAVPACDTLCRDEPIDLASATLGGEVTDASDLHYSHPSNMLRPTPSAGMWDGWETRRRRDQGHDWVVVRLGVSGDVGEVIVDTTHFKGNAPGWVSVELSHRDDQWRRVVDRRPVGADRQNHVPVESGGTASHLRLSIHPDGGVARMRVLGRPERAAVGGRCVAYLDAVPPGTAERLLATACGSRAWVREMARQRPFATMDRVLDSSERMFDRLEEDDWLEAFAAHPRIGERGDAVARREQSATANASRATLRELVEVNRRYEEKYGFTYIVYATGKTADEMLAIAKGRLDSTRDQEIETAALEQRKITRTRLRRMMCQEER